ncbi:MAG: hypothetical protein RR585_03110 [Coprobacillus sp.]
MNENLNLPSINHWEMTDVKEVQEIDLSNNEDLCILKDLIDSNKWVVLSIFNKNGSNKPPFLSLGRII